MKILVGIKHVPDTETKIKVAGDGVSLRITGPSASGSSRPFDEYALEAGAAAAGSGRGGRGGPRLRRS